MKTLFIPCHHLKDPLPVLKKKIGFLGAHKRVGLVSTIQHLPQLMGLKKYLDSQGKEAFIHGKILGCDASKALENQKKLDCYLYVGSGRFHPLALATATNKPVYTLNPLAKSLTEVSEEEKKTWLKRKKGRIARASQAEVFGILVSTKTHQSKPALAWELKRWIEAADKKAFVFAGEELTPDNVLPFKVDAWVNTACPRIVDDFFSKPVINPDELEYLF